jgi:hypothetical protein
MLALAKLYLRKLLSCELDCSSWSIITIGVLNTRRWFCRVLQKRNQPRQIALIPQPAIRLNHLIATRCYFARIETEAMLFSHSSWSLPVLPLAVIVNFSFSMGTGGFSIFMSTRPRSMPGS